VKKKRAYASVPVNRVAVAALGNLRPGQDAAVGLDIGKHEVRAIIRWSDGSFEQGWKVLQPSEVPALVERLCALQVGRQLRVGMEPTGTYGDPLRQALTDANLCVQRVSPKASHDYAEVFDGVPSQHDGKDAAVVAELVALGKGKAWPFAPGEEWERALYYWVEELQSQRRELQWWVSRLEGLLARYWPEATRRLSLRTGTLLQALARYGDPRKMVEDAEALRRLGAWSHQRLSAAGLAEVLAEARRTIGVRMGPWERRQMRQFACRACRARRRGARARGELRKLAKGHKVLEAQGAVVGVPTACVLWSCLGDPRKYDSGGAYRKAMGLNLAERSSGKYQGELHISKRGQAAVRQWLYFAALRLSQREPLKAWFQKKKTANDRGGRCAAVAVMRKLALALHGVAVKDQAFDLRKLAATVTVAAGRPESPGVVDKKGSANPKMKAPVGRQACGASR
jgi:transposase